MGLTDKVGDMLVKGISKKETIRIPYDKLADMVNDEFIKGADDEFLQKVQKTAKGGGWFTKRELISASGRYRLYVGAWNTGYILGRRKMTYIFDNTENKFYQLDSDWHWKKFYKRVSADVQMEKINRGRSK